MPKRTAILLFYLAIALFAALGMRDDAGVLVPLRLVNGASEMVHYYIPQHIRLSSTPRETALRLPLFHAKPRFATLVAGTAADSLITIAIDETADGARTIYIDRNNNSDLTDDGPGDWDEVQQTYVATSALINVAYLQGHRVPLAFRFYRFIMQLPDMLLYYRDYCAAGTLALADRRYKAVLVDDNADGCYDDLQNTALIIDTNLDGTLEATPASAEMFAGREPFHLHGESYVLRQVAADGQWARFGASPHPASPKVRIEAGQPAPEFSMPDIDGRRLRLADFRGRVVLLHFWATWCKPCVAELPYIISTYGGFHRRAQPGGFDIIGVSLDEDPGTLRRFLEAHDLPWRHLCDGQGWGTGVVQQYRISSLPRMLVLDGDGIIRYVDPRGADLAKAIAALLEESRANQAAENPEFRNQKPH